MKQADVLAHPAKVLGKRQREEFFDNGFTVVPDYVPQAWLIRLREAAAELIDRSRTLRQSDGHFILEANHSPDKPSLHRIASPQEVHPVFWEFFRDPVMTDLAADVVGPDVKFFHAKLNVKSEKGSGGFKWHHDITAWPHTDFSPVTIGVYLEDCGIEQGPLAFVPGTNRGELHRMYDEDGVFTGIDEAVMDRLTGERDVVRTPARAGSAVLVNCRVIHGSAPNKSELPRPLLLPVYSSADSFPYTPNPVPSIQSGELVRGSPARYASFDTFQCLLPPDFRTKQSAPWEKKAADNAAAAPTM
ncbi:MAG: phytanoyl-CoA dioxygenase family protein [Pseudomonadota bacterium]